MALRYTAEEALARIVDLPSDQSGDESDDRQSEVDEVDESSESSTESELEVDAPVDTPVQVEKDGTNWQLAEQAPVAGRYERHNVFTARVGVTNYCRNIRTPVDAWRLLIDEGCIRFILDCTIEYARNFLPDRPFSEREMESFIGLLYLRCVMNQRNFPLDLVWSKTMGCPAFSRTMPRNRIREIKKYLRFDKKSTRRDNLETDKFCMISWVLKRFIDNSQKSYDPAASMTIDEQLFPTKARCRFTQYMPNKPDNFGIKLWILAEVETKFCCNMLPYLGKDEMRQTSLGTHVVMKLTEPLYGKGFNMTTDNFFTSKRLAENLLQRRITIVGTVRCNRRELPPPQKLQLHDSVCFQAGQVHLTR